MGGQGVTEESDEVLTRVDGGVGLITLNRPKAINSLNQSMVDALRAVLTRWEGDDTVRAVVLSGAGERGLCAGGDVVAVYHSARKDGVEVRRFWRDEYLLDGQIGRFPKPYVSLMDGIVMGGGVGVSAHGSVRVVTETSKVAMPEVGIGFIPDVGGAFLLSRAPGGLGLHAALTGAPFSGADAIAMGFADHYMPHSELDAFTAAVIANGVESEPAVRVFVMGGGSGMRTKRAGSITAAAGAMPLPGRCRRPNGRRSICRPTIASAGRSRHPLRRRSPFASTRIIRCRRLAGR